MSSSTVRNMSSTRSGTRNNSLSSASHRLVGGGGHEDDEENEDEDGTLDNTNINNRKKRKNNKKSVESPATKRSGPDKLKKLLIEKYHLEEDLVDRIPKMGVGIFLALTSDNINDLMETALDRILVIAAQKQILSDVNNIENENNMNNRLPPINNNIQVPPINLDLNGVIPPEIIANGIDTQDNVDPYCFPDHHASDQGKIVTVNLYGTVEGGKETALLRLPSCKKGAVAPKGQTSLNLHNLGIVLLSTNKENLEARIVMWSVNMKVLERYNWQHLGTSAWDMQTQDLMRHIIEGMALPLSSRTVAQANCVYMFPYLNVEVFSDPVVLRNFLSGNFHVGVDGVQLQNWELTPGGARANSNSVDTTRRNKGLVEMFDTFLAWLKTFVSNRFEDPFRSVINVIQESEFLQRVNSSVIAAVLNEAYSPIFCALKTSNTTSIPGIVLPVSLKGAVAVSSALYQVSLQLVPVLSSPSMMRTREEDIIAKTGETKYQLDVIKRLKNVEDIATVTSAKKIEGSEGKEEERKKRVKKSKVEKRALKTVPLIAVKTEPGSVKKELKPLNNGGAVVKREAPCVYHLANRLMLKNAAKEVYKCPYGIKDCRFKHLALTSTTRMQAETATFHAGDQTMKAQLEKAIPLCKDFC